MDELFDNVRNRIFKNCERFLKEPFDVAHVTLNGRRVDSSKFPQDGWRLYSILESKDADEIQVVSTTDSSSMQIFGRVKIPASVKLAGLRKVPEWALALVRALSSGNPQCGCGYGYYWVAEYITEEDYKVLFGEGVGR